MNYGMIVTGMLILSTLGSWALIKYQYAEKAKQVKWALFVLYFWLANFIQLIFLALAYYFTR